MTDVAVPLAWAGRSLSLLELFGGQFLYELSEAHPGEYTELFRQRYVANLMRPMWGVLFEEK